MKIKQGQLLTVVDNQTGKETTGYIVEYTPERITLEKLVSFDSKKVHFKDISPNNNKKNKYHKETHPELGWL